MILFDIEPLQNDNYKHRGIGRYVRNLLAAFREAGIPFAMAYNPNLQAPSVSRLEFPERFIPATRGNFAEQHFDWLVTMSPFEASLGATANLFRNAFPKSRVATIVYDLIPLVFEADYLTDPLDRVRYRIGIEALLRSDHLLCISEYTKADLIKHLSPDMPVDVIGTGVDGVFFETTRGGDQEWSRFTRRYPLLSDGNYIFAVSGGHKTKNLKGLLQAYATLPFEFRVAHPLVIGGGMPSEARQHFQGEWRAMLAAKREAHSDILILPHLEDDIVRQVYRRCGLFICASLYEGYGLPLAEALVSGAVCVSSYKSSLAEILPLAAYQFNPAVKSETAAIIAETMTDNERRSAFLEWASEVRDGYRWHHVGNRLRESLTIEAASPDGVRSPASSIAVIGPMRPSRSGIANYDTEILQHLSDEIQWFSPDAFGPIRGERRSMPLSLYDETWQNFTQRVYVIGNSFHHLPTLHRLAREPGIVWLHDVRLWFLAWDYALALHPPDPWVKINEWAATYPGRHERLTTWQQLEAFVYSFARPLLRNATGFIVHSNHARELLIEDFGGVAASPPITVIPHAVAEPVEIPGISLSVRVPGQPVRIGILGFIHPIRKPETVIAAAGIIVARGEPATVVILGQIPDDYLERLRAQAASLDVAIEAHGYLEDDEFFNEIAQLDVVIQIRGRSNGESSGTVANTIAAGVSVITNIPSVHEFWGEHVLRVSATPTAEEIAMQITQSSFERLNEAEWLRRREMLQKFSYKNIAQMFERAIETLFN